MRKWELENIEEAIVDFYDGTLSEADAESLQTYLAKHPELPSLEDLGELPTVDFALDAQVPQLDLTVQPDVIEPEQIDLLFAKQLEGDTSKDENRFIDQLREDNAVVNTQHELFQGLKLAGDAENHKIIAVKDDVGVSSIDELAIAFMEGDLSPRERRATLKLGDQNPELKQAIEAFKVCRVESSASLVFSGKAALMQGAVVVPIWKKAVRYASVAAAILMLFGVGWWSQSSPTQGNGSVATIPVQINREVEQIVPNQDNKAQQEFTVDFAHDVELTLPVSPKQKESYNLAYEETQVQMLTAENRGTDIPELLKSLPAVLSEANYYEIADLAPIFYAPIENVNSYDLEDNQYADNTTINLKDRDQVIKTIREKGKDMVYGDDVYAEDSFLLVLTEKAVESIGGEADLVAANDEVKNGWKLKLGKVAVSRY